MSDLLRQISPDRVDPVRLNPVDAETLAAAENIVADVKNRGWDSLIDHAVRLGDLREGDPAICTRADLEIALASIDSRTRELLERTASRIRVFAGAQRASLSNVTIDLPGGRAGHTVAPVQSAGCYAPGGRYPLPSSVLMTAATAKAAGVSRVWVASPRPSPVMLAAAVIAGADGLLCAGGAQAIAALAYGAGEIPACDAVVGPGNLWVTAAKQLVSAEVKIDMLAGPSELVVLADKSADASTIAADLLAQAEHDPDALPVLVTTDEKLIAKVERELAVQLEDLPTADIARAALQNGFTLAVSDLDQAVEICDRLAPEHLELIIEEPGDTAKRLRNYGALFIGSAEVFGDYGAGPNHVLPTGGGARYTGGLSVLTFLKIQTWLDLDDATDLAADAAQLARLEGLEAHARAAEKRAISFSSDPGSRRD
jgi:phosphoribosyl-ATP pyrophosphohydrolase/phosphoribosyl-AMP cyclohydrolase/histidinol dehydrogenase